MWVFTKYGFYSVVCAREGDGRHGRPVDPARMMIRARLRSHLEALQVRFPDLVGGCEIQESADADYACRIFVDKAPWQRLMALLADDIDYDNFKSKVARHQGAAGSGYEHALHDVWTVMHRLQRASRTP